MGSVIDIENCPNCGGQNTYHVEDYYKTGEVYRFCMKCGYVHNHIRTENGFNEVKDGGYGVLKIRPSKDSYCQVFSMEEGYQNNPVIFEGTTQAGDDVDFTLDSPEVEFASALINGEIKVIKGADNPEYMDILPLKKANLDSIRELDALSSFCVAEWIEGLDDAEESETCFGVFSNDELIGYCVLGSASDIDEAKKSAAYNPESRLLSDVFVRKEFRNKGVATVIIDHVLNLSYEDSVFLAVMHDGLFSFYERFGFERVPGTENLMVCTME